MSRPVRSVRRSRVFVLVGAVLAVAGVLFGWLEWREDARRRALREHGAKAVGVVSDRFVVEIVARSVDGEEERRRDRRLFFQPAAELDGDLAALWARTSKAMRYPGLDVNFKNWDGRIWQSVSRSVYDKAVVGERRELWIDGEDALLVTPEPAAPAYALPGGLLAVGVVLLALALLDRRRARSASVGGSGGERGSAPSWLLPLVSVGLLAGVGASELRAQQRAVPTSDASGSPRARPHILIVLADDLGWTDLSTGRTNGGNGSPYFRTPRLDQLAERGTCFVNAYSNGPNCAPTRAALWSGQWAARTGVYTVASGNRGQVKFRQLDAAHNETVLAGRFLTLAERVRSAGYTTGHFGKWHLGGAARSASPTEQGFDVQVGGNARGGVGGLGHFADQQGAFRLPGLPANGEAKQFLADRLTEEAITWMGSAKKPFFCCLSHFSVHTPIQAPQADFDAVGKAPEGSRHSNRRYAAMLKNLDDNVGRVLDFLAATEDPLRPGKMLESNTLVVFASDNGGLGGYARAGVEGGKEVTDQAPLRSGKGSLHDGGVRVPLVVAWPGVVAKAVDPLPVQLFDLHPTLAAIAGAPVKGGASCDGMDLSRRLLDLAGGAGRGRGDRTQSVDRALFWHFPGYLQASSRLGTWRTTPVSAIRRGSLKAMFFYESRAWSLFDLEADIGEDRNLAAERPAALRKLAVELRAWLKDTEAPMATRLDDGRLAALPTLPAAPK
ncbi:MAG: sulfatase [Planctomycetota bacterium]